MADWTPPPEAKVVGDGWKPPADAKSFLDQKGESSGTWYGAMWQGLKEKVGETMQGTAELAAKTGSAMGYPPAQRALPGIQQGIQQSRQEYQADPQRQAHPIASGVGEFAGLVGATAPMAMGGGASIPARMGLGAASGAAAGLTQPVGQNQDYWKQKAIQATAGGVMGAAVPAAGGMLSPPLSPAAQQLQGAGVRLTPGQRLGGITQGRPYQPGQPNIDANLASFPILRSVVSGHVGRSAGDFSKAGINQALEPIGVSVPRNVAAGKAANAFMEDSLDDAYNKVLPHVTLNLNTGPGMAVGGAPGGGGFGSYMQAITQLGAGLSDETAKHFVKRIQRLEESFGPTGVMDGPKFKIAQSALTREASRLKKSPDAYQQEEGEALHQVGAYFREALEAQNPGVADDLRNINYAYAMSIRVRDAAARRSTSEGIYTPADLLEVSKRDDPTKGHRAFTQGDALMQDLATAGQRVLSGGIPAAPTRLHVMDALLGSAIGAPGALGYKALDIAQGSRLGQMGGQAITGAAPAAGAAAAGRVTPEPPPKRRENPDHTTTPPNL